MTEHNNVTVKQNSENNAMLKKKNRIQKLN